MFERQKYKKKAKIHLSKHWKTPLLISFIGWVLFRCIFFAVTSITYPSFLQSEINFYLGTGSYPFNTLDFLLYSVYGVIIIASTHFYISFTKNNDTPFTTFLEGFALWSKGIRGFLWSFLWCFLWALLLFIPGIVKLYAYSQIFFVMADNPKLSVRKAMKLSIAMTHNHKGELFIMSLSFLGWILLLSLVPILVALISDLFMPISTAKRFLESSSFIVYIFVQPYIHTSFTHTYYYLKQNAIDRKILTYADFGQKEPVHAVKTSSSSIKRL